MKKASIIFACLLMAGNLQAQEVQKPKAYTEIVEKCHNEDLDKSNACLKKELILLMGRYFDKAQEGYLIEQLEVMQNTVETGELDKENPEMVKLAKDPELLKQRRAKFLNGLWESILLQTLNTVEQNKVNIES